MGFPVSPDLKQLEGWLTRGFPGGSDGKESACNVGDLGLTLIWEDPLEEGMASHSNIIAWKIPMDRGAWQAYKGTLCIERRKEAKPMPPCC